MKKHSLTKALKKDLLAIAAALPKVADHEVIDKQNGLNGTAILADMPLATEKDGSPIVPGKTYYNVTVASANHFRRLCKAFELGGINSVNAYVEPFRPKPAVA